MLVVLLPPPWQAGWCSCARVSSRRVSSGHLRCQELAGGGGRAEVAEYHIGVQLLHHREGQVAADRVEGLREGRALGLQHRLIDDRRDVLVAEDVLRVGQHHVLSAPQLRVGREDTRHLDPPAVQRGVDRSTRRHRHELQVAQAVGLLQAHKPLVPGLLGLVGAVLQRAEALQLLKGGQVVLGGVRLGHGQVIVVLERRGLQQREAAPVFEPGRLLIGLLPGIRRRRGGAYRPAGPVRDVGQRGDDLADVLRIQVDRAVQQPRVDYLGRPDVLLQPHGKALGLQRLGIQLAQDQRLGEVLRAQRHRGLARPRLAGREADHRGNRRVALSREVSVRRAAPRQQRRSREYQHGGPQPPRRVLLRHPAGERQAGHEPPVASRRGDQVGGVHWSSGAWTRRRRARYSLPPVGSSSGGHELVPSVPAAYRDGRGRRGPGWVVRLGETRRLSRWPLGLRVCVQITVYAGRGHGHSWCSVSQESTAIRDTMRGLSQAVNPGRRISSWVGVSARNVGATARMSGQYCCAMPNDRGERGTSVQSVNRAVSILQVLARHGSSQVTHIAAELGVHKSTVFRLLATLEARGLVEHDSARGRYRLGYGVVQLAAGATRKQDLSLLSRPVCGELAEKVGETVNVAIHDGRAVISIDQVIGSPMVTTVNWVGQRTPMHATSAGKVFLANMLPEQVDAILAEGLESYTPHTLTDPAALKQQLALVRDRGYARSMEEHEIGLAAVAAPIRSIDGEVIAAVAVSGPIFRLNEDTIAEVAEHVLIAAAEISQRNGYPKRG